MFHLFQLFYQIIICEPRRRIGQNWKKVIIRQKLVVVLGLVYIFATRYKPENGIWSLQKSKEKKARKIHSLGLMKEKTNKRFSEDLEEKHMYTYALCSQNWFFYAYNFLFLFVCLFFGVLFVCFWPRRTACRILVPQPGTEPAHPAVEAQCPIHWTTTEVPMHTVLWLAFLTKIYCVHFSMLLNILLAYCLKNFIIFLHNAIHLNGFNYFSCWWIYRYFYFLT